MNESNSSSTPANAARQLRDAVRALLLVHGALDDGLRPCGTPLSRPHAWALLELFEGEPMTVTQLATRLHIDRTNVSRLCDRLERLGELERVPHPDDRRARLLRLTEHGRIVAHSVDASSARHFEQIAARLPDDPRTVVAVLGGLASAMTRSNANSKDPSQ